MTCKGCDYFDPDFGCVCMTQCPRASKRNLDNKEYAEVKHGEWIDKRWTTECDWCDMNHHSITCSVCKEETYGGIKTKYCPDCGAKMDGKKGK